MARRNLFQPPAPPKATPTDTPLPTAAGSAGVPAPETKSRFPNTGAMSGMKSTLKDLSSNAIREIPTDLIEEAGPKDRLAFTDDEIASLAQSIRQHGQQVPIMVRPIADQPGHFRVVYGRRRLRALRSLGLTAKALVRSLSDEQAVLAQGQENSQRLDPSFIEKARFVAQLSEGGYDQSVVMDALAIDKPMLSRMLKVTRSVPASVIEQIGAAHGIGRRRWEELADAALTHALDLEEIAENVAFEAAKTTDERFARLSEAVSRKLTRQTPPKPLPLTLSHKDGTRLAEVNETARAVTIKLSKADAPEFVRWLSENAETELSRLYETWQSSEKRD